MTTISPSPRGEAPATAATTPTTATTTTTTNNNNTDGASPTKTSSTTTAAPPTSNPLCRAWAIGRVLGFLPPPAQPEAGVVQLWNLSRVSNSFCDTITNHLPMLWERLSGGLIKLHEQPLAGALPKTTHRRQRSDGGGGKNSSNGASSNNNGLTFNADLFARSVLYVFSQAVEAEELAFVRILAPVLHAQSCNIARVKSQGPPDVSVDVSLLRKSRGVLLATLVSRSRRQFNATLAGRALAQILDFVLGDVDLRARVSPATVAGFDAVDRAAAICSETLRRGHRADVVRAIDVAFSYEPSSSYSVIRTCVNLAKSPSVARIDVATRVLRVAVGAGVLSATLLRSLCHRAIAARRYDYVACACDGLRSGPSLAVESYSDLVHDAVMSNSGLILGEVLNLPGVAINDAKKVEEQRTVTTDREVPNPKYNGYSSFTIPKTITEARTSVVTDVKYRRPIDIAVKKRWDRGITMLLQRGAIIACSTELTDSDAEYVRELLANTHK